MLFLPPSRKDERSPLGRTHNALSGACRHREEEGGNKGQLPEEGLGLHQEKQPSGPATELSLLPP